MNNAVGPGTVNAMDRATIYLPQATMGIIGMGAIGVRDRAAGPGFWDDGPGRRPVSRIGSRPPEGVDGSRGSTGLRELLAWSDFAVIAAPHTPETERLFDAGTLGHLVPPAT